MNYLCTGEAPASIAIAYRISPFTVPHVKQETCRVIWDILLAKRLIKALSTEEKWKLIAEICENEWNCPYCLGTIDGNYVMIQAASNTDSMYFNYKKIFFIVHLVVCSAQYQFAMINIDESGRNSNAGIFGNCALGDVILRNATCQNFHWLQRLPSQLKYNETISMEHFAIQGMCIQLPSFTH